MNRALRFQPNENTENIRIRRVSRIHDNPAERLLAIIKDGKKIQGNSQCRDAWRALLETQEDAILVSRLGKLMELPHQIVNLIKEQYPSQNGSWTHWVSQVNSAFTTQNLNSHWNSFIGCIDDHSVTYLGLTADLLANRQAISSLPADSADQLRQEIAGLLEETLQADIPDEIRIYVTRSLRKILISIEEYKITGALPILDSVEAAIGHSAFDQKYREFLKESDLGKRIASAIASTANMVTVVVGLPQLPAGVDAVKRLLGA